MKCRSVFKCAVLVLFVIMPVGSVPRSLLGRVWWHQSHGTAKGRTPHNYLSTSGLFISNLVQNLQIRSFNGPGLACKRPGVGVRGCLYLAPVGPHIRLCSLLLSRMMWRPPKQQRCTLQQSTPQKPMPRWLRRPSPARWMRRSWRSCWRSARGSRLKWTSWLRKTDN